VLHTNGCLEAGPPRLRPQGSAARTIVEEFELHTLRALPKWLVRESHLTETVHFFSSRILQFEAAFSDAVSVAYLQVLMRWRDHFDSWFSETSIC
jgi:hypothetical protein